MNNQIGLNSSWTDSLALNQHPDATALLAHLRSVHQRNTGFTETCASTCRDETGRNSYEWLAEVVPDVDDTHVLDLACGSGPLLEILRDRRAKLQLTGVDMSPEELALARTRLSDNAIDLLELNAQDLSAVKDNSIDVVLCHWALTLMNPIAPVLDEVRRVLSSSGQFAALVDGPMKLAPGYADVHDLIYAYVQAELPSYGEIDLGDPRIRGTDSLIHLVSTAFPEAKVTVESSVVSMEGPVTEMAETAAGFFYAAFVLPPAVRITMLSELSNLISVSKNNEDMERKGRFSMPINRLLVAPRLK